MAVRSNQEMGGFKLLEEDALDDRPCPAVKRFVSSILDRKDMKDKEVASSFRNLMEYRDSTSSPSACSVGTYSSTVDADRINSPPSPSTDTTQPGPMDDQRLPNELLDEICEDIGMKEGMELDFVEYLMEQDANPHMYMTQEAISSTNFHSASASNISTPCGSTSGGSNNGSDNKTLTNLNPATAATTSTTTTPNFLFKPTFTDTDWPHPLAMSIHHSSSSNSSGSNTVKSSENRSPANKRVHLSASADVSPNKGQQQTLAAVNQQQHGSIPPSSCSWFKMPQPGLMTRPGQTYFHAAPTSSPVQSTHSGSSHGSSSSYHPSHSHGNSRSQELSLSHKFQPVGHLGNSSEQEGISTNGHLPNRCSGISNKSMCGMSPKPAALPCDFGKSSPPSQLACHFNLLAGSARDGDLGEEPQPPSNVVSSHPQHNHLHHHQQRVVASAQIQVNPNIPGSFFNKGICPPVSYQTQHVQINHHRPGMVNMSAHHAQIRTPVDSPLDQGYFSNESAGNCSSSSAASPAFTSSSMSSLSATSTILPADHSQKVSQKGGMAQQQISGQTGSRPGQKSVHFADMTDGSPPAYAGSPGSMSMDIKQVFSSASATTLDCSFEMDNNGQPKVMPSGKILPRFNHSMKSGIAPYTVPNSQSQVMVPAASPGYDVTTRSSCAVSCGSGPNDVKELTFKPSHIGCSGNGAFYVDSNQNMMRVDSVHGYSPYPPPLVSPQTGEFIHSHQDQSHFGEGSYSVHQQQMAQCQQAAHPMSAADPALSLQQSHPHLQSMQHARQHHQFTSCCLSSQGMNSEVDTNHQKSMQITSGSTPGYQIPLPTTVSNHTNNTHLGRPYGGQACPPSFESANGQVVHSDVYANQAVHGLPLPASQGMLGHQEPNSFHRDWRAGMSGSEELQVQVAGVHPNINSVKGGLQLSHTHPIPHMQPSQAPNCSAPMGPGPHMQDLNMMNSGIHSSAMGPQHPHVGPSYPHMGPHPEYGPCMGLSCNACKMAHASQHHPHMGPNFNTCKPNHPSDGTFPPHTLPHMGPCAGPGCAACKLNQNSRPQILSSQQKFIQHLIMDEGNSAYRSHPLFPLLRDLVIAEMNFDNPRFHYQQLLSLLPNDFNKLLQNFLHRNPPSGHYQSNQAVESVIMDSLRLAHGNLLDKIRHRQELEKTKANSSATLRTMEEFCHKFDPTVNGPMQGGPLPPNGMGSISINHHPMGAYHENNYIQPGVGHVYHTIKDRADMFGDPNLASPQASKAESKKHPSLPKEAVAMMMEWLRNHKDNPYPNDDEKALLIKQTGLSVNQINYWFTNARRRILPKWSQCKT